MNRPLLRASQLVAIALLVSACAENGESAPDPVPDDAVDLPRDWPFGTVLARDEFNTTMQTFEGSFLIVEGCMFLSGGGSGPAGRYLAAFPYPGVGWDADTETLDFETADLRVSVGEGFSLLGDVIPSDRDHRMWLSPPPQHCAADNVFLGFPLAD